MYIKRAAEDVVKQITKQFGVLLITGPRQVGKTTLLQKLAAKDRKYVTWESIKHFKVLEPLSDPERFGALAQPKINIGTGAVVCMANDLLLLDKKNWSVPAWLI